jgi:hypothetical protein
MRFINAFAVAVILALCFAPNSPVALADEEPVTIVPAPELEIFVTPTSGSAPVDVEIKATKVYHPFGAYQVSCSLVRDNSDGINVHPRLFKLTQEGTAKIPWRYEIYLTEPGRYILYAEVDGDIEANAPSGNWEYAPGGVFEVEIELNFGVEKIDIPKPRPEQNPGCRQVYLQAMIPPNPDAPLCIYSIYPMTGKAPLTIDVMLAGSFSPAGNSITEYSSLINHAIDGQHSDPNSKEIFEAEVTEQSFIDPLASFKVSHSVLTALTSPDPHFRYEITETGCYIHQSYVTDSAGLYSKTWKDYINVFGKGQQPPVAKLTSSPASVEFDEITLLQHFVDEGKDIAAIRGREDELIRVMPRGAVAVTFDASGSRDPDGSIVKYYWDIYDEGEFFYTTGSKPTLTYYAESWDWPLSIGVAVLVVDNDGFVAKESLYVGVEQDLPFGSKADIQVSTPGEDDDEYYVPGFPSG